LDNSTLAVKHLTKFFGKKQALSNITFECQKGHIVGLIGANGAGKTTIMKSILSMIKSDGDISINGQTSTFDNHKILSEVGSLIEYPGIYPYMSGRDHLKIFTDDTKDKAQRIQDIITELNLKDYIDKRAKGYSLGMKQKLGIAMALVNDPSLVILDEPMNGLDPKATKDLRELILKKKAAGTTFLISSHILGELQKLAEDLIVIDHGKVIKKTTMASLLENNNHYLTLSTNNDPQTFDILKQANYTICSTDPLKIILPSEKSVENIMELLASNNITVRDLRHIDDDLEDSVLKIIAK